MIYLTSEQVLFIHYRLLAETGGEYGVIDLGLLQSAVGRPKATFDGEELYSGLFSKSAALFESLVNNHAFIDGNKRTAIASADLFLRINGCQLTASNQDMESFVLQCAQGMVRLEEITHWFEIHSRLIA